MLQEPQLSPYDLQFKVLGFPVRICWGFWLAAAVIGWNNVSGIDYAYSKLSGMPESNASTPGTAVLLLVHALSLLLSILIHELGHTFLFRHFGTDSRIVLYHFGGLAIPGAFTDWNAGRRRFTTRPQDLIAISAAGPLLQLMIGLVVWGVAYWLQITVGMNDLVNNLARRLAITPPPTHIPDSAAVLVFLDTFVYVSVFWAVLNLLPIMPLDGGQIMREVLRLCGIRNPVNTAALVSMITAGMVGLYAFQNEQQGSGLMCIALLASNYQLYQSTRYGGY